MKCRCVVFVLLFFGLTTTINAQEEARLSVVVALTGEIVIVIQPDFHSSWGFLYPMTYQLDIPQNSNSLKVEKKHGTGEAWVRLPEKASTDLFNAIEAVRFDYAQSRAYVSAAFAPTGDSLFLRVSDQTNRAMVPTYRGISQYYDNRRAAVTITADDWSDWTAGWYSSLLPIFRSYGLYVTAGVISRSDNTSAATWSKIQQQLDSGFVEVAAHSRTHPDVPYADPVGEVAGCYDDIVKNVSMSGLFGTASKEYVYVWLAPYGHYDSTVDSLLSTRSYLVPRLYPDNGDSAFGLWNGKRNHFAPIYPTREIGAPSWGGGSTDLVYLNAAFDAVVLQGGIYHFMWHPQTVFDDRTKPYFVGHLGYISRRNDIWYANLGHMYLYHLLQQANSLPATGIAEAQGSPHAFELHQNYPNPFNPSTTIPYTVPAGNRQTVSLQVFDILGRLVTTLVDERKEAGSHEVRFDGSSLASGVYFYRLLAGSFVETRRLLLLR